MVDFSFANVRVIQLNNSISLLHSLMSVHFENVIDVRDFKTSYTIYNHPILLNSIINDPFFAPSKHYICKVFAIQSNLLSLEIILKY